MRITFITSKVNFERGGGSVPDLDLKVRDMKSFGADVRVVTVFSELNLLPANLPYPVTEEFTPDKSLPALQRNVLAVLRKYENDTDIYHIEGQFSYAGAWYRSRGGKPVVAFYNREMLVWERRGGRVLLRRLIEKCLYRLLVPRMDFFYFTTPHLREEYNRFGLRVERERTDVVLDFYDATAVAARAHPRESRDSLRIFTSGRMIPEKGFALLVDAVAALPVSIKRNIELTIGGDGPERANLVHRAKQHGLNMQLPGWTSKEELGARISDADIFVLPRWRLEQPSVIVMEALALGATIVAPGGGGIEWMAQGAFRSCQNDDVRSLSEAIRDLAVHPEERRRLRHAALARSLEIDHSRSRERLFSILRTVLARSAHI